jgi:alginate production protein
LQQGRVSTGVLQAAVLLCLLTVDRMSWGQQAVTFDFDDPPETENRITDSLSYGIEIELDGFRTDDLDLDNGSDDDQTVFEPKLDVAFTFQSNETLRAYVDLELSRIEVIGSSDSGESDKTSLGFKEAYVTLREIFDGLTAQIGRQQFQDPVEWYYDQELDALRAYYRIASVAFEASLSEQGFADEDFLNGDDTDEVINAFLVGHHAFDEDTGLSGYLLHRDGRERESEDLTFIGVQSEGELTQDLDYWLNAAYVTGDAKDGDGSHDVRGFGVDLITTYAPEAAWEPSVTLGFAFGTGDDDPGDGVDHSFRQTGLQENNASFNGVTRFKYYGEVFDPELNNLAVLTLGGGLKPSESSSLDLVYHYYRQDHASAELRSSNLDAAPDGRHRELGHEVDFVLGYLGVEDLSVALIVGTFFPGQAFESDADNAYLVSFEIQYEF